jgi:DNA-directed RNA polymerase subunit RPC12/RpoP
MIENYSIQFTCNRCFDCGTFWAIETSRTSPRDACPRCSGKQISNAYETVSNLERSLISMRGALTKAKNQNTKTK